MSEVPSQMVTIYGRADRLNPIKARMSDVLHRCFVEVLGMPEDKRAHRFVPMDPSDFYYPGGRSEAYTAIAISMIAGRSRDTITRLIHAIFEAWERELGVAPIDVEITITEQPAHCWGFRGMTGEEAMPSLPYKIEV